MKNDGDKHQWKCCRLTNRRKDVIAIIISLALGYLFLHQALSNDFAISVGLRIDFAVLGAAFLLTAKLIMFGPASNPDSSLDT